MNDPFRRETGHSQQATPGMRTSSLKLVIGSKNSSSWSLRPWLLLKQIGVPFEEVVIPLRQPDSRERILLYSPSGKVPVLIMGQVKIWDSLAIAEFLAEHKESLWPADAYARAFARSICAEMHSGFQNLRTFMPMDFVARFGPPGKMLTGVQADIRRVLEIWTECRSRFAQSGPFLFGRFTIADAMYGPVCSRFTTYAVPLDPIAQAYVQHMMNLPAMREWGNAALAEVSGAPAEPAHAPVATPAVATPAVAAAALATLPEPTAVRLPPSFAPEVIEAEPASPDIKARPETRPTELVHVLPAPSPIAATTPPQPPTPTASRPSLPPRPAVEPPRTPAEAPVIPLPEAESSFAPVPKSPVRPGKADAPSSYDDEARRSPRPIPSTVMIKPIGDGTRRRR